MNGLHSFTHFVYLFLSCLLSLQTVYKPWLCAQYFQSPQSGCSHKIPCEQYCLEVQQRCPFILPDNDDLIHGGTPSFICRGWYASIWELSRLKYSGSQSYQYFCMIFIIAPYDMLLYLSVVVVVVNNSIFWCQAEF